MDESEWLARSFEAHRVRLRAAAYRMLGPPADADDAVQETWLRLARSDGSGVQNLGGRLTTVAARVCLDMLRARAARREDPLHAPAGPDRQPRRRPRAEQQALLADSVWLAPLVVLDTRSPPSGSRSCCTTPSRCRSRRSRESWTVHRPRPAAG